MKLQVSQTLKTITGGNLLHGKQGEKPEPMTLKIVLIEALLKDSPEKQTGIEKLARWELANRIYSGDIIEVSSEEITLIKNMVNTAYTSPMIVGQVFVMLNG